MAGIVFKEIQMKKATEAPKKSKLTLTLTLDARDAEVLNKATNLSRKYKLDDDDLPRVRRWFISWCIRSVSEAVIRLGGMPCPLAVEMRHETPEETAARTGNEPPKPTAPNNSKPELNAVGAALTYFQRRFYPKNPPTLEYVGAHILQTVLAHPDVVENWISAAAKYREDEGFKSDSDLAISRIKARREYRRVKLK